jgi:hypothetical protein
VIQLVELQKSFFFAGPEIVATQQEAEPNNTCSAPTPLELSGAGDGKHLQPYWFAIMLILRSFSQ